MLKARRASFLLWLYSYSLHWCELPFHHGDSSGQEFAITFFGIGKFSSQENLIFRSTLKVAKRSHCDFRK